MDARVPLGVDADYPVLGASYTPSPTIAGLLPLNGGYTFTLAASGELTYGGNFRSGNAENYLFAGLRYHALYVTHPLSPYPSRLVGAVSVATGTFSMNGRSLGTTNTYSGVILQGSGLDYGAGLLLRAGVLKTFTLTPKP
jgi:hypothetical protein